MNKLRLESRERPRIRRALKGSRFSFRCIIWTCKSQETQEWGLSLRYPTAHTLIVPALTGVDEPRQREVIKGVGEITGRRRDFLRRQTNNGPEAM